MGDGGLPPVATNLQLLEHHRQTRPEEWEDKNDSGYRVWALGNFHMTLWSLVLLSSL